jgi:hypothetical protein
LDNIRILMKYREPSDNFGVVSGRGTASIEGERLLLDFGGVVISPGVAKGRIVSNYFGPNTGTAQLSDNGQSLTIRARSHTLSIHKDQCENRPPVVSIESPPDGTTIGFAESINFRARVVDEDQTDFERERMVFYSDRDGKLGYGKVGPDEASLWPYYLSPGDHMITFTATDDGGLSDSAEVRITVSNSNPEMPTIVQPNQPPDMLIATGTVLFEGRAYDHEDGPLEGTSLVWSLSSDGTNFTRLGTGRHLEKSIDEPGDFTLRLGATDTNGASSSIEKAITVLPYDGNTPPRVKIDAVGIEVKTDGAEMHQQWLSAGDLLALRGRGIAVSPGETLNFSATAEDAEDQIGNLTLEWSIKIVDPAGTTQVFGDDREASVILEGVDGVTAEVDITFRAIDSAGLAASSTLTFFVMPVPLI